MAYTSKVIVLDIATAGLSDAAQFLEPVYAPSNYRDQAKIDAYVAEKTAEQAERCGLDPDLCRISGIGFQVVGEDESTVWVHPDEAGEARNLEVMGNIIKHAILVGYNAKRFDWPILHRRAAYLGVDFPSINLDRFKSPHIDLYERLTNYGQLPSHSLKFYAARHGWLDIDKPLDGAAEAKVYETQDWDGLRKSIAHDVEATMRLAKWMRVL